MSISIILIHAWNMQSESVHKTGIKAGQETKFGLKLIASLKRWIKKKASEVPKYLTGKEKKKWLKEEDRVKEQEMKKDSM